MVKEVNQNNTKVGKSEEMMKYFLVQEIKR